MLYLLIGCVGGQSEIDKGMQQFYANSKLKEGDGQIITRK